MIPSIWIELGIMVAAFLVRQKLKEKGYAAIPTDDLELLRSHEGRMAFVEMFSDLKRKADNGVAELFGKVMSRIDDLGD